MTPEALLESLNQRYAELHRVREDLFWQTRMGVSNDQQGFVDADGALTAFRQDAELLTQARAAGESAVGAVKEALDGWVRFFGAHGITAEGEARERAVALRKSLSEQEAQLASARSSMQLGFVHPTSNEFVKASSVKLGLALTSDPDEDVRKACFRGLESIERFVLDHGLIQIFKTRNQFARSLGYANFYEYKLSTTEGISVAELTKWLEDLEAKTRDAARAVVDQIVAKHGPKALEPWNFRFLSSGDAVRSLDPYMPFSAAVSRWGQSFAGMGVRFHGAEVVIDLVDRAGKYENGFCHAPVPPYVDGNGQTVRARIGFTSNAVPGQVGSGHRAAETLFHEGGHAAHFAGIAMPAPCFSQEYAPTSAAFAETQSMFMDSLLEDADWLHRYANVPFEVVASYTERTHPLRVVFIRNLLVVAFAELAIYALPDDELTETRVREKILEVERKLTFLDRCPRPTLSVPHLLDFDSSAIYHGYILAEAAVAQTRHALFNRLGHIVDNPQVGPLLNDHYWRPGNSRKFTDLIEALTGAPFGVDALAEDIAIPTSEAVARQRRRYEIIQSVPRSQGPVELDLDLTIAHGAEIIARTRNSTFEEAARSFAAWMERRS